MKIKRFKLKKGEKSARKTIMVMLYDTISVTIRKNEGEWDDVNDVEVLDETFLQPYTPFYDYLDENRDIKDFPYLEKVVRQYNKVLGNLPWLEEDISYYVDKDEATPNDENKRPVVTKRDKVILGLKICSSIQECIKCPYYSERRMDRRALDCDVNLMHDAIQLLEE